MLNAHVTQGKVVTLANRAGSWRVVRRVHRIIVARLIDSATNVDAIDAINVRAYVDDVESVATRVRLFI